MSEFKIISRSTLYQSDEEKVQSDDGQVYAPNLEFVEVSVTEPESTEVKAPNENTKEYSDEEFAFPLFAGASTSGDEVMKVSLKDDEIDVVVNERPENYYRALYSAEERKEFKMVAVSFDELLFESTSNSIDSRPWKVINLSEHNAKIELELKRRHRKREGKRKRDNKIICRERRRDREKIEKRLQREVKNERFRVRKHDWSNKSSKAKLNKSSRNSTKPKYRTE